MAVNDGIPSCGHNGPEPDGVNFGFHVVALIDFLGQAQELMKWDFLRETSAETEGLLPAIQNTYGRIMRWREKFRQSFERWQTDVRAPPWMVDPDPKDVETFEKFQEFSLGFMHFTDTMIVYSPLTNLHGFPSVRGVTSMIITTSSRR